jgi:hypothetical protein
MRETDFANIALGMESTPSFAKHLQDGMVDRFAAIMKALTNSSSQVVKIYGCVMTVVGNQYDQTAGVVYYNGNFHTVDVFSGNSGSQIPVYVADNIYTRQVWYGDLVKRDTFFTRKLKLQLGASGSGIANYNQAVLFEDKISEFIALQTKINTSLLPYAPLASPALTGNPTAPTQSLGNNSTRLANTAFVQAALAALVDSSPGTLDTLNELAAALGDDPNFATTITTLIGQKLALSGGSMTGDLSMGSHKITNLTNGSGAADAVNKAQLDALDTAKVNRAGDTITGALVVNGGVNTDNVITKTHKFTFSNWNMDTTDTYLLTHSVTDSKILGVQVFIQDNVVGKFHDLRKAGNITVNNTQIELFRTVSGLFDDPSFINTSVKVLVEYEP